MPLQIFHTPLWVIETREERFLTQDTKEKKRGIGFWVWMRKRKCRRSVFADGCICVRPKQRSRAKALEKECGYFHMGAADWIPVLAVSELESKRLYKIGFGSVSLLFLLWLLPLYLSNLLHFLTKEESVPFVLVLHPIDLDYSMNNIVPTTLTSDDNLLHDGLSTLDKEQ